MSDSLSMIAEDIIDDPNCASLLNYFKDNVG